jgi:hypothetical protein
VAPRFVPGSRAPFADKNGHQQIAAPDVICVVGFIQSLAHPGGNATG